MCRAAESLSAGSSPLFLALPTTICPRPSGISTRVSSLARQTLALTSWFFSCQTSLSPSYYPIQFSLHTLPITSFHFCERKFGPSPLRSVTGMIQSDLNSAPVSRYKEEPPDDSVSTRFSFGVIVAMLNYVVCHFVFHG